MICLSEEDRRIINLLCKDLPLQPDPFSNIAERAGVGVGDLLQKIGEYRKRGLIRRFGAVLNHNRFKSASTNAMVVWEVGEGNMGKMAKIASQFPQVSHCYQRKRHPKWKYNFYTMIHGNSTGECRRVAGQIATQGGTDNYRILVTTGEYKKSLSLYFSDVKNSKQYRANKGK